VFCRQTLQHHIKIFESLLRPELDRMSGPKVTKYDMRQGDTKMPPPKSPLSYDASMLGPVDTPFPQQGPPVSYRPLHIQLPEPGEPGPMLGSNPETLQCFHCEKTVTTRTVSKPNRIFWFLLFISFPFCCCCVLCCINSPCLQQVTHYCPSCNYSLGVYEGKGL